MPTCCPASIGWDLLSTELGPSLMKRVDPTSLVVDTPTLKKRTDLLCSDAPKATYSKVTLPNRPNIGVFLFWRHVDQLKTRDKMIILSI